MEICMKKILTFALCFIVAIFAVGCTFTPAVNLEMDSTQPWTIATDYEKCIYKVTKLDSKGIVLGEGSMTIIAQEDATHTKTTVTSSYEFTPTDTLTPLPDTITSSSTFLTSSCVALSSEKTVTLKSNPDLNYRFVADYENRKVDFYMKDSVEITKTLSVPSSEKVSYDNESLYYLTRAFNPEKKNDGNFLLTNLYDCYDLGKISSYSVYFRASNDYVTTDDFTASSKTDAWANLTANAQIVDSKVDCHHVKINRNRSNMSGAPVEMWLTKAPFKGGNTRVMIKMRTTVLTIPDAHVDYTMEYDLVSYSLVP